MPGGWTKPIRFLCYSLEATATMPSVLLRLCRCRARWLGSGLELTIGVSPGRYPPDPAAAPSRIAASFSISSISLLSCASLIASLNS